MNTDFFQINLRDIGRAILAAIFMGAVLAFIGATSVDGFDVFTADWGVIVRLSVNGAFSGFIGYLILTFVSNKQGKAFGKI